MAKRADLFYKQDRKCFYCHEVMNLGTPGRDNTAACTLDHKTPKSRIGWVVTGFHELNIVAACHRCNNLTGALTAQEFMAALEHMKPLPPLTRPGPKHRIVGKGQEAKAEEIKSLPTSWIRKMPNPGATGIEVATFKLGDVLDDD